MKLLALILLFTTLSSAAQQHYLRGQVKDSKGVGLSAVQLRIKSTGQVYQSGAQGYFGIPLPKQKDTILFSLSGFHAKALPLNAAQTADVRLEEDEAELLKARRKLLSRTENYKVTYEDIYRKGAETYSSLLENRFQTVNRYPTTQLTLHGNKASYGNVRRLLTTHSEVPPDAVRIDELLNYFQWSYKPPINGDAFSVDASLSDCPWNGGNQLLFLNICSRRLNLDGLPPSHLVFLIDISGSMDLPTRLPLLKSGFRFLVNSLRPQDSVSLVAYGGKAAVLLEAVSGSETKKITATIDSLQAGGNTPGENGIRTAYRLARRHYIKGGNNRVMLATDGDFNVGIRSEEDLEKLIEREKQAGIYLTCLGVGMGDYKDSKIQVLAQKGSGNFAYIDNIAEAEKVLFKEFFQTVYTVADNASVTLKFDSGAVKQYRLIGYDNKISAARDASALVQGGEVGTGSSLMVVFELVPGKAAVMDRPVPLEACIRYNDKASVENDSFCCRLSVPLQAFEQLESDCRFAAAVILFGMKLKRSAGVRNIKWEAIQATAKAAAAIPDFSRQEFVQLIEYAKKGRKAKRKFLFFPVKEE